MRLTGSGAFQFEIAGFVAERQARRQIAIGADGAHRERVHFGLDGAPDRSTSERKTSVPSSSRQPEGRREACQKACILARVGAVAEGIERLEPDHFAGSAGWR